MSSVHRSLGAGIHYGMLALDMPREQVAGEPRVVKHATITVDVLP
jgi:hypothetical protein